jgi:hypothetical protein
MGEESSDPFALREIFHRRGEKRPPLPFFKFFTKESSNSLLAFQENFSWNERATTVLHSTKIFHRTGEYQPIGIPRNFYRKEEY